MRIGFIGAGKMCFAMLRGLKIADTVDFNKIWVSNPRVDKLATLKQKYGINYSENNVDVATYSDVLVLSCKPQNFQRVSADIKGVIQKGTLVISILAGVPINQLVDGLGHEMVVRAMPNLAAQIGQGITVWCPRSSVTDQQLNATRQILTSIGEEVKVDDEKYLDMATALSGSGPAFIFMFMEALIDAGVHIGFPRNLAKQLVTETMVGSIEVAKQSEKHLAELRNEVTSPAGTTTRGLYEMEKGGLRTIVIDAIQSAHNRCIQLAQSAKA